MPDDFTLMPDDFTRQRETPLGSKGLNPFTIFTLLTVEKDIMTPSKEENKIEYPPKMLNLLFVVL